MIWGLTIIDIIMIVAAVIFARVMAGLWVMSRRMRATAKADRSPAIPDPMAFRRDRLRTARFLDELAENDREDLDGMECEMLGEFGGMPDVTVAGPDGHVHLITTEHGDGKAEPQTRPRLTGKRQIEL